MGGDSEPWRRPYHWWGLPWTRPNPSTLEELVAASVIGPREATWLFNHVRTGGSVTVSAGPSGVGKSTLAHALAGAVDPGRDRVYIRGTHEPFDWQTTLAGASTTLLVNEISPHLPVYCWGESARTVLRLACGGYQLIATAHANSVDELAQMLRAAPISATIAQVVALDVVVFLDAADASRPAPGSVTSIMRIIVDGKTGRIAAAPVD